VGATGLVLQTVDGGVNWQPSEHVFDTSLFGVACGSDSALIVGQQGAIFKHKENKWEKIITESSERLISVDMNDAGLAIAVGGFGTVLRSNDGGKTWEPLAIDWFELLDDAIEPHLYDVSVGDNNQITLVGEFELILQSNDGGVTWVTAHKGEASLFDLHLQASGKGYAVGQQGRVLVTEDSGATWAVLNVNTDANLLGVISLDSGRVVISGIRALLSSSDSGANWSEIKNSDAAIGWYQGMDASYRNNVSNSNENKAETKQSIFAVGFSGRLVELAQ